MLRGMQYSFDPLVLKKGLDTASFLTFTLAASLITF
jgi:hypothetical protein